MIDFFFDAYKEASWLQIGLEFLAFIAGIVSVWFAKKENIWVYPTGLVATVITTYLLYVAGYLGDMILNGYFAIMSIYGWYNWGKEGDNQIHLPISRTNKKQKIIGILLFIVTIVVVFALYKIFDYPIHKDNYVDMITSGMFFTGMWYMAKKKIENWTLWIIADAIAVPLYAYRGLGMLSLQYVFFTILAISAYAEWKKTLEQRTLEIEIKEQFERNK